MPSYGVGLYGGIFRRAASGRPRPRAITGTAWSGPRFFALKSSTLTERPEAAHARHHPQPQSSAGRARRRRHSFSCHGRIRNCACYHATGAGPGIIVLRGPVAAGRARLRKGMWVGGPVPLGYAAVAKRVVVKPAAAETVRAIFARYLELGSVQALAQDLERSGIRTRQRRLASGRIIGDGGRITGNGRLLGQRRSSNAPAFCAFLAARIRVSDPVDGAVPVVGEQDRAVFHRLDVGRTADVSVVGDEAGDERLDRFDAAVAVEPNVVSLPLALGPMADGCRTTAYDLQGG
jgi:hypothetical protein